MNKYQGTYYSFRYSGSIRPLLKDIKYEEDSQALDVVAKAVADDVSGLFEGYCCDCLCYVPSYQGEHVRKLVYRISREIDVAVFEGIKKVKNTKSQCLMNGKEARKKNVEGAFEVTKKIDKSFVLLIDNVITTGATMDEVAGILEAKGATVVRYAVACSQRTKGGEVK